MTDVRAAGSRAAGDAQPGTLRQRAYTGYRWLLILFLVAGAVQVFLAGLGVFHLHAYGLDAAGGDSALTPHRVLGSVMAGIALLILLFAVAARPGGWPIGLSATLAVLTSLVQSLLAGLADDHAVYGGLHALDGFGIIAIAAYLLYRARPGARRDDGQREGLPDREAQETR